MNYLPCTIETVLFSVMAQVVGYSNYRPKVLVKIYHEIII